MGGLTMGQAQAEERPSRPARSLDRVETGAVNASGASRRGMSELLLVVEEAEIAVGDGEAGDVAR